MTYSVPAENEEHAKQVAWERFQLDDVCWAKTPEEMFDLIEVTRV